MRLYPPRNKCLPAGPPEIPVQELENSPRPVPKFPKMPVPKYSKTSHERTFRSVNSSIFFRFFADCILQDFKRQLFIIIIITNEEIKVTLSRKRCRGTLQDYDKGKISKCQSKLWKNRNVFSWCLNGTREETVRRDGGRMFIIEQII